MILKLTSLHNSDDLENNRSKIEKLNEIFKDFINKNDINNVNDFLKSRFWKIYVQLGHHLYSIIQNHKEAIKYFKKAITSSKSINFGVYVKAHSELGGILMVRGELNKAIEYFEIVSENYEVLSPRDKITFLNRKGILQAYRGNFEEAISLFQKGINYAKQFDSDEFNLKKMINMMEGNLWEFYAEQGKTKDALKVFEDSLSYYGKEKPLPSKMWVLFNLIKYGSSTLSESTLKAYLSEIKEIYDRDAKNIISRQYYNLGRGIILNKSDRLENKVEAQKLFREVANEPIVWFDLTFESQRWFGRSLLQELQYTSSDQVLDELSNLINQMIEIAKQETSNWLLVEGLLLKAKLELIKFNFKDFENILSIAHQTAKENSLTGYLAHIDKERTSF
ncbi:MAG: tetratricopeptide repeat protein, partial [Candidatus Kariarchaeaceae archaeon]